MSHAPARSGRISAARVLLRAALLAAPMVAVLAVVFLQNARSTGDLATREMAAEAMRGLDAERALLLGSFEQAMRDVLVLTEAERIQDLLNTPSPRNLARVGELFLLVVRRKGYDQLRYLDPEGREVVRVNLNVDSPAIVLARDLQDKADRYYVRDTLALEQGAVYVSPLDLNQERGSIEVPHKPTVRICTPVFDRLGRKRGILAINLLARNILDALGHTREEAGQQTMLLNRDGYWMKAPDPDREWGSLLPERRGWRFDLLHAQAWAAMQAREDGDAVTPEGLFAFQTVRLAGQVRQWPGGPPIPVRHGRRDGGENAWRLVSFLPRADVAARVRELRGGSLGLFGLSAAAMLLLSGGLALSLERRRAIAAGLARAEEQARALSADLQGVLDASTEVAVIATDPDGLITVFNAGAERMLGYSAAEMVGRRTPQAFHLESEVAARGEEMSRELGQPVAGFEVFVARAREGRGDTREWTYVRKGGDLITVRLTVTTRRDARGELAGFLGMAVDVTAELAAESRLQFQNLLLEAMSDSSPDAIVVVDEDDQAIYHNRRFRHMWGLPDGALDGSRCSEILARVLPLVQDPDGFARLMEELYADPLRKDFSEVRLRDGRTLERQSMGLRTRDGGYLGRAWFYRDVTERVRAAEALAAGEERLRLFIRHTPAAVAMFDAEMRYIVASRRWNEDYGLGERDLTGLSHYEVFPEIGQDWKDVHQRVLAGEIMREEEDPFPRADGSMDWVRWENVPWRRDDGSIGGIVMFTEVVTERKLAKLALAESQERLVLALKGGDLGLWDWNVATGEVLFDERWAEMLGYTLEDLPPAVDTWSRLVHPEDMAGVTEALTAHLEGRTPMYNTEHRLLAKDGSWHWVLDRGKVVSRDAEGKPLRAVGTHQDITERRQADERLRLSQARLDAVVNTAVDGIVTINTAGIMQTVNPAAARIFGYDPGEMVGQPVTMLQIEPYRSEHDAYLARYLATGEPHIIGHGGREVPGRRKDGEVIPLDLSVSEVRVGEQWFFTGMLRDISERKRLEVELLGAKEQAEAASQAKSEFLARMSHEIRTPMNAVLGLTHLALQTGLDERQRDYLTKVQASARLLLGIINDILDFSKIEAGRMDTENADFDLDEVLDGLAVVVGQGAEAKGLALSVAADPDVPRLLSGDALRLTQVLVNLMNNAVKFTEQGEVSLRASLGEARGPGVPLRLVVRDTGMGMDEAARSRLFQSFSQADESITRRFGGTGLGLAISKRLVELMGGSIAVESEPGRGSVFTVDLVLAPGSGRLRPSQGQAPPPEALAAIRGAAVLVAEDNAINRQVARELLAAAGVRSFEAENGLAALEAVREKAFDLVLMDVHMPVMDGHEATRRIRALEQESRLPIVAMTASALAEDRNRSLAAGMDDHLPKPFSPESLARMLVKWIKPGPREPLPAAAESPAGPAGPPPEASPALDAVRGRAQVGGNPGLYRSLLAQFAQEFADTPARLEAAFAAADPDGARRLAHSLRGVAGNLGAGGVARAATEMEQALKAGDTARARSCLAGLATALRQTLESIGSLDAETGNREEERLESPVDASAAVLCLDRLAELLARQDLDADAAAAELARLLAGTDLAASARRLAGAVSVFDYVRARKEIASLHQALARPGGIHDE